MNDHTRKILRKMFDMVGAEYSDKAVIKDYWWLDHEWTVAQEKAFEAWYMDQLKDGSLRRVLYGMCPSGSKESRERLAKWFIFCYGWKVKQDSSGIEAS